MQDRFHLLYVKDGTGVFRAMGVEDGELTFSKSGVEGAIKFHDKESAEAFLELARNPSPPLHASPNTTCIASASARQEAPDTESKEDLAGPQWTSPSVFIRFASDQDENATVKILGKTVYGSLEEDVVSLDPGEEHEIDLWFHPSTRRTVKVEVELVPRKGYRRPV